MRRLVGITTTVACSVALLVGGIGPAAAQTVTPASFTKQVCDAVAAANRTGKASNAALEAAAKAYKATPSPTTAAAVRNAMTQALQTLEQQFSTVLASVQQAGTPASGTEFVTALTSALESQRAAAQQIAQHSAAIDATSSTAFVTGFQQVVNETKTTDSQSRTSAKSTAAFQHAARPFRPLVHLLTTKADTCTKG